jgi:hypothetical protein
LKHSVKEKVKFRKEVLIRGLTYGDVEAPENGNVFFADKPLKSSKWNHFAFGKVIRKNAIKNIANLCNVMKKNKERRRNKDEHFNLNFQNPKTIFAK